MVDKQKTRCYHFFRTKAFLQKGEECLFLFFKRIGVLKGVDFRMGYTKEDVIRLVQEEDVEFIRLQFTDIFGTLKNIAITASQLEKALDNKCMFDRCSTNDNTQHCQKRPKLSIPSCCYGNYCRS